MQNYLVVDGDTELFRYFVIVSLLVFMIMILSYVIISWHYFILLFHVLNYLTIDHDTELSHYKGITYIAKLMSKWGNCKENREGKFTAHLNDLV